MVLLKNIAAVCSSDKICLGKLESKKDEMEQNDVDGSDSTFLLLVNFSGQNFVRGADG